MVDTPVAEPLVRQGISLRLSHMRGLRLLAGERRDGNVSRSVQTLVEDEMARRFGPDWRTVLTERAETAS